MLSDEQLDDAWIDGFDYTPDEGPIYIRLGRESTGVDGQVILGTARYFDHNLSEGKLIITTGEMLLPALDTEADVLHYHTLKPFDRDTLLRLPHEDITVWEDHTVIGGLGSAVAEVLAPIKRVGVNDVFVREYGTVETLRQHHMEGIC